jgi:acyl-[acyl-carrier-protein]-phospholipid O-acyltransferase/long-chain-fatty-acid--[acyl-carrier-protein] ligase
MVARKVSWADRPAWVGLAALVGAQFLGIFNDNLFKMVVSLLAIDAAVAIGGGSAYLSLTAVLFVVPYVLFSGYAGCVADRFDRRRVLIVTKALEIVLLVIATVALIFDDMNLLLVTLFLVATQATFFSPAKYAILPDIVTPDRLARANGLLESGRYLAIILGTVAGGTLLTLFHGRPGWIGAVMVAVAVAGWAFSLLIRSRMPAKQLGSLHFNPWHELRFGLVQIARSCILVTAVGGLAAFDFLCTLATLGILLVAKTVMGASDLQIGLIGAGMAIGAGLGCVVAGRMAGSQLRAGIALAGMVGVGFTLELFAAVSHAFIWSMFAAFPLGFFGGLVIVPLNAIIQTRSVAAERGRVIAAANFLSMTGCLLASGSLWLLHDMLGMSAQGVLAIGGVAAVGLALAGGRARMAARTGLEIPFRV